MPMEAQRECGSIAPTHSHHAPVTLTPAQTQYPMCTRLGGGSQGQSGGHGKFHPTRIQFAAHPAYRQSIN